MNFFCGDKPDSARLDFGNPALDLPIPGSLSVGVSLPLQGLQEFFCEANAILGGQSLGSS
jgi:hypothetical protein